MSVADVVTFYDEFSAGLLADYVYGNARAESAIRHALRWIPAHATRILDVGCGIGWSTWELKRHFPSAFVLGIDISPKTVAQAKRLFPAPDVEFVAGDITTADQLLPPSFDAIVMLDVYEHIPRTSRTSLHQALHKLLAIGGRLILTCPSVYHQEYLRRYAPDGLQPIDEDVTVEDTDALAEDIQGEIVYRSYVTIWRAQDYMHVVIQKKNGAPAERQRCGTATDSTGIACASATARAIATRLAGYGIRFASSGPRQANRVHCSSEPVAVHRAMHPCASRETAC